MRISAQSPVNDFVHIQSNLKNIFELRPSETIAWHNQSRKFIEAELRKPFAGKIAVVTHHTPSLRSVHPRFRNDPLTPAFSSNCDDVQAFGANLWIHGHTHVSFDYMADLTRVVCSPPQPVAVKVDPQQPKQHAPEGPSNKLVPSMPASFINQQTW
jgi:hypothetical protein